MPSRCYDASKYMSMQGGGEATAAVTFRIIALGVYCDHLDGRWRGVHSRQRGTGMTTVPNLDPQQRVLLVFLNGEGRLDPIRIMKGMFLFAKETPEQWMPAEARYEFVPYNYGPCSFQIYSDLDFFVASGLVESTEVPGQSWGLYSVTSAGAKFAEHIAQAMDSRPRKYLSTIRDFVAGLSFNDLLTAVYRRYPDYAVNSVFKAQGGARA